MIFSDNLEDKVKNLLKIADSFYKKQNYSYTATQILNVARVYHKFKEYDHAKIYIDSSFIVLEKATERNHNYFSALRYYYSSLIDYYDIKNDPINSLFYAKKLIATIDEAHINVDKELIAEAEFNFNNQQNQQKLAQIAKDTMRLKYLLIIASISLLIAGLLLYYIYLGRKKIIKQGDIILLKNDSLKKANHKNELLLSEVHHRIKNNLQNIISLIYFKGKNVSEGNPLSLDDLTMKIRSIALIHEQLYIGGDFELINLDTYLSNLLDQFVAMNLGKKNIIFTLESSSIKLNIETVTPLALICTELLSNSIKHNPELDSIHLVIKIVAIGDKQYELQYKDSGKGFDYKKSADGIGIRLISSFVRQLMGTLEYVDSTEPGVNLKIQFKEKIVSKL